LLDRTRPAGTVAHLNRFFHRQDEYLSIADRAFAAGAAKLKQAIHRALDEIVVHGDFQLHLAQQIGGVFVAAVGFGLTPLSRKAHGVANGETAHPDPFERLLHQFELGGLDDSDDKLHGNSIAGQNAVAYSILGPAIWAKCSTMTIISRQPGDNLHEILANWFTATELGLLHAEEIVSSGFSGARFWSVIVGERAFCLRRNPRSNSKSAGHYIRIHRFLEHLWNQGFREIACPVKNLKQDVFVETFDAVWELSNFLPSDSTRTPTLAQAVAAAEFLARLHVVAASYQSFPLRVAPGLKHRRAVCEELRNGKLDEICAAIENSALSPTRDLAINITFQIKNALPIVFEHLKRAPDRVPVQFCLVDCHIGNFLFTGDQVTGLVDFATVDVDSVARDVARLFGSVATMDQNIWRTCVASYQQQRSLSAAELKLALAYHTSGLLGRAARWLEWRFITRADFADAETTRARLMQLSAQIAAIPETEAVFASIQPYQM
jgi:Ser/Thr protein kinase RdoA (MazF antagonist)